MTLALAPLIAKVKTSRNAKRVNQSMKNHPFPSRAPGGPGIEPRWTHGTKVAVGTAYSTSSRVWYTLDAGCVTEVYYPTIDTPQIRDLQFLFTDGATFLHDERRNFTSEINCVSEAALGFEVTNRENEGRYTVYKTILGDPYQNCLLIHVRVDASLELLSKLKMYVLCALHLEIGGWHNNSEILHIGDNNLLLAHKGNTWLAIGATVPFTEASCGYVGVNDGWTDLADNYRLDWQYEEALDGNIALTGGLDLSHGTEFTVGVAFGTTQHDALSTLGQSLNIPFERTRETFIHQWEQTSKRFSLASKSNNAKLYERSVNLLLAHEDKTYSGAMIASLSIPWGDQKSDEELGGYHLVWTREPGKVRYWLAGRWRYKHAAALSHLSCRVAAGRRRLLPKFLDRRPTILDGHSARRGCLSNSADLETLEGQSFGQLPSL
jgi:glucoamylase